MARKRKPETEKRAPKAQNAERVPVRHNGVLCWQENTGGVISHTPLTVSEVERFQNTH